MALEIYHSIVQDPSNPFIVGYHSKTRTYLVSNSLAIPVNLTVNEALLLLTVPCLILAFLFSPTTLTLS